MMQQQVLDFSPYHHSSNLRHRSYGGLTPSQWRDTSIQAAEAAEKRAPKGREKVLMAITRSPMANHEIAKYTGILPQTVCARVAEVREDGYIEDSGIRRPTESDYPAVVWKTTLEGERVGRALIQAGMEFH